MLMSFSVGSLLRLLVFNNLMLLFYVQWEILVLLNLFLISQVLPFLYTVYEFYMF